MRIFDHGSGHVFDNALREIACSCCPKRGRRALGGFEHGFMQEICFGHSWSDRTLSKPQVLLPGNCNLHDCRWLCRVQTASVSLWSNMTSDLKSVTPITYLSMCIHCLYGMDPLGGLQGHNSLKTASEAKSDLRFEICDLKYICNQSFMVHDFLARRLWQT